MPGPTEAEPIQYEADGSIARIWLNRPHKRNCVSQQLLAELESAVDRAERDKDIRVMVIRGRGTTFCWARRSSNGAPTRARARPSC